MNQNLKNTFGAMTQQHISRILPKTNTIVLALFMFHVTIQKNPRRIIKVLSCVIHTIISSYVCIDYLGSEKKS